MASLHRYKPQNWMCDCNCCHMPEPMRGGRRSGRLPPNVLMLRDDTIDFTGKFFLYKSPVFNNQCLAADLSTESDRHKDNMALTRSLIASLFAATTCTALQEIPPLGLGTWLSDREKVPHAVEYGLQNGYDHIDAAWIYRTFTSIIPLGL